MVTIAQVVTMAWLFR